MIDMLYVLKILVGVAKFRGQIFQSTEMEAGF